MSKKKHGRKMPPKDAKERVQQALNQAREQINNLHHHHHHQNPNNSGQNSNRVVNVYLDRNPNQQNQQNQKRQVQPERKLKNHPFAPTRKFIPHQNPNNNRRCAPKRCAPHPQRNCNNNAIRRPEKCPQNPGNFCACNADEGTVVRMLPQRPNITYCADKGACGAGGGGGCGCSANKNQGQRLQPKSRCNKEIGGYEVDVCCDNCGDPLCEDFNGNTNHRCEIDTAFLKLEDDCDCCEHGIPYGNKSPHHHDHFCHMPPPVQNNPKEKPIIIVNNTDLCECEEKWSQIERWKEEANRKEHERKRDELKREYEEAKRRCKERRKSEKRRRKSMRHQQEEEENKKREERRILKEQREIEDRRFCQEEERWIEELCDREEERRFIDAQERRRDERSWRQDQLRERSTTGLAMPELEEMRRVLAPVQPGPNEIFEYFTAEPRAPSLASGKKLCKSHPEPAPAIVPTNVVALPTGNMFNMGSMDKPNGFRLKLPSGQQAKTTVQLRMGPPGCEQRSFNITSNDACADLCGPAPVNSSGEATYPYNVNYGIPQGAQNVPWGAGGYNQNIQNQPLQNDQTASGGCNSNIIPGDIQGAMNKIKDMFKQPNQQTMQYPQAQSMSMPMQYPQGMPNMQTMQFPQGMGASPSHYYPGFPNYGGYYPYC